MVNITKWTDMKNMKKRLKESFSLMDGDADGYLDYYETKAALKALGLTVKKSYILSVIRMYDKLGCNKICFEDFYYVASDKLSRRDALDEIKCVFELFTRNSTNKKITLEILQTLNKKLDCNLTDEETKLMINEFDFDEDGSIDLSEFIDIMTDYTV